MDQPTFGSVFKASAKDAASFYRDMLLSPYHGVKEGLVAFRQLNAEGRVVEASMVLYLAPLAGVVKALRRRWAGIFSSPSDPHP